MTYTNNISRCENHRAKSIQLYNHRPSKNNDYTAQPHRLAKVKRLSVAVNHDLTHCGPVIPHGDIDLGQHWLR